MSPISNQKIQRVLRLEAVCILVAAVVCYAKFGAGWGVFTLCFFLPDISLLAYRVNSRVGTFVYNTVHSYAGPMIALVIGLAFASPVFLSVGMIWGAHIAFERMFGYGLEYSRDFEFKHLGLIDRVVTSVRSDAR
ncbi:MAG TPA: DUF4260 domain-containing protein [Burkholderiaceae bacterium]|nr:DUF4260 domain-containing protein [Burkholderiaceae bacterium]